MPKILIYTVLVLASFAFLPERNWVDSDCQKFRKGVFYIKGEADTPTFKIERNDTMQIETKLKTGDYANFKIVWTGPCEYELTFLNQHVYLTDSIIVPFQKIKLKSKIIRTDNDSCFYTSHFEGDSLNFTGLLYINSTR